MPNPPTASFRRDVRDNALTMANYQWTLATKYNFFSDGTPRPSDASQPTQMSTKEGTVLQGIPYTWGGFDSPWTHSDAQVWTNWSDALNHFSTYGPLIGKTNTNCGVILSRCWPSGTYDGSAGIDCSGFVAAAVANQGQEFTFTNKPNTTTLASSGYDWNGNPSVANSVLRAQPMNFFVTTGGTETGAHTLYYEYGAPDAQSIYTLESTVSLPNPQGAKEYSSRSWAYLRGWQKHRSWIARNYLGIGGDGPREPRYTPGAGSGLYGLRGQSIWYQFSVGGPTVVTVNNVYYGDPDLYIYNGDPRSSTAELTLIGSSKNVGPDSVSISSAGTYWARVYIYWVNYVGTPVTYNIGW